MGSDTFYENYHFPFKLTHKKYHVKGTFRPLDCEKVDIRLIEQVKRVRSKH